MSIDESPPSLDRVVTEVATRLMAADSSNYTQVYTDVLEILVDYFGVDVSFLRRNDHEIGASILVAEWPLRPEIPDPDPLRVVYFADADPVFAELEHRKKPLIVRPEPETDDYQRRIEAGRNVSQISLAATPLVSGERTTGALGFVKYGNREWVTEEINALQAIASLLTQAQSRVLAEEQLRYLAEHDDLTGLNNRRALIAHLDARLQPGQPGPVTALFFDLDRLKAINDYLGHSAGDSFIRVFAQRLTEGVDSKTVIARLGGDEFVVVPADPISANKAEALAYQLQDSLRRRVWIDGERLTRAVSVGVASGLPGSDTSSDLLRRADQAVLSAKSAGGDRVAVFTTAMSLETAYRNDIELHLQDVIENGALLLNYLPEIDMRTGKLLATEALVRWDHPTRGLLPPAAFIGIAESINLAGELGRWVLRTACREFARWREDFQASKPGSDDRDDFELRVNVSPVQLVTDGFAESVAEILDEFGLDRGSVCLEITENVVVQDSESSRATLADLRRTGVRLAIDDFGTGYSVLSHLKSLPVDILKIDRSFVTDLGSNPGDLAIVRAIIALADSFGLQIVAEGVETKAAATTLLRHGCHRAQGFLLSRPLPSDQMATLYRKGRVPVRFTSDM
ncbi:MULTISPECIES: putative bifunctional diguanylate cyclase/phosphodiesterase [Mycobacteriaceae]|uniref:Bifunctional diguanylate cyclase/phosphodiesterase n=1 Tax=Mycolicibacterium mucogenicum DSM 44124 TaxID=1226753 RepID=A0A8H2JDY4_MYCMU|nr:MULTISPECIES: EAL domain-containing protein [Mycobacteriaceae]QPG67453.1 EAL domain-containing protein [Mycolicibacterium mucogenicum DSM 44124]SEB13760.1 diguanylate cyclase (GGDEF) domain-containing protein [Mycobacterium sp. 283mftsu]